jgi:signal transduction histidine kinase
MGLAIVKKVIKNKGGSIRIESAEGEGARFIVRWPKKPAEEDALIEDLAAVEA